MSVFLSIKRLVKHSAVYGIGHIVNRTIGFILLPLYTNYFPRDEFGVAGVMSAFLTILTILYAYGLDAGFFRYYMLDSDPAERKRIFSTTFYTTCVSSLFLSALLFLFAPYFASIFFGAESAALDINLPMLIRILSGMLLFDTLAFFPMLILRAEERSIIFIVLKFANVLINLGCNIFFLYYMRMGIEGIFLANLISSLVLFTTIIPILLKHCSFIYSFTSLRSLLLFGLPYLPSGIAIAVMDTVDRLFLERLASVQAVGLYNAGARLGMVMGLLVSAFRYAWHPYFLATSKEPNAKEIYARVFTLVILGCSSLFLFISIFINDIVKIRLMGFSIIGPEFWDSTMVVPVIMLAYIMHAAYLNFYVGIYLKNKTIIIAFITVAGMLVNVLVNYFLIPSFDIMGAAWARFISYSIIASGFFWFARKYFPIRYEWNRILKLVLTTGFIFILSRIAVFNETLAAKLLLCLCFPVLLFLTRFFQRKEMDKVKEWLRIGS